MSKNETKRRQGHWRMLAHTHEGQRVEIAQEGILDELVIGEWLHVEQLDDGRWWMRVGDARLEVQVDGQDGPPCVDVTRGFYDRVNGTSDEHLPPLDEA